MPERRSPSPPSTSPATATSSSPSGAWISSIPNLAQHVPNLRRTIMLPGCGHWTQQERADEVNAAMIEFLKGL